MWSHGWRATKYDQPIGLWKDHMLNTLRDLGYDAEKVKLQPRHGKRISGFEACRKLKRGVYILNQYAHVSCVRDGELIDTADVRENWVYNAWRVFKIPVIK